MLRFDQPLLFFNGEFEIFFQPFQFHLELANLLIKFEQKFFPVSILLPPPVRKETRKFFKKLFSPLTDLIGMNSKFTGKLGKGLLPFDGFQRYLRLEGCIMPSPHAVYGAIPPSRLRQATMHLIPLSSIWGVL